LPEHGPRQNRAYYIKLWRTHGIVECWRGDQLGKGKTELFLDPDKKVRIIGRIGEWFVIPARAIRAVQLRRDREIRSLKKRIEAAKAIPIEIRSWE
jgi:hypothetical protein